MKKAFFVFLLFSLGQLKAQIPTNGLIGYYPFCGTTTNAANAGHDLSINGGAILSADRRSLNNAAYEFNGVNAMLYADTFKINYYVTYLFWINVYSDQQSFVLYNGDPGSYGVGLIIDNGVGTGPGHVLSAVFTGTAFKIGTNIALNQWHLVTLRLTITPSNIADLIVDTTTMASAGYTVPPNVKGQFCLGANYTDTSQPFYGKIDDVMVYNRAISDTELKQIYFAGCSFTGSIITAQPVSVNDTVGKTVLFNVSTSVPLASFQWQQDTGTGWADLSNSSPYSGVHTNKLIISPASIAINNSRYRCVVANLGCCSDTSNAATLNLISVTVNDLYTRHVSIYPNPVKDELIIKLPNKETTSIMISSCLGQKIIGLDLYDITNRIDVHLLPAGLYLLELKNGNGKSFRTFSKE